MFQKNQNRPATGPGPFDAEVFNANLSKSFPETLINVVEGPHSFGYRPVTATAVQSVNKQGQDVKVWWNGTQEAWQYGAWQPSRD